MSESISFKNASIDELQIIVARGEAAKQAMQPGTFLYDTLMPCLEKDLAEVEAGLIWAPGSTAPTIEQIAMDRIWRSGISFGLGKIWANLNRMKNEGVEAGKEMGVR
jgi:hypothetical protein